MISHVMFLDMDDDESGSINYSEMQSVMELQSVKACFTSMGLELSDVEKLFQLIDDDGSGDISIDEFLSGCLKLRGEARSFDVHSVLRETKRIERQLLHNHEILEGAMNLWSRFDIHEVLLATKKVETSLVKRVDDAMTQMINAFDAVAKLCEGSQHCVDAQALTGVDAQESAAAVPAAHQTLTFLPPSSIAGATANQTGSGFSTAVTSM